jgi:hypothetical protein
MNGIIKYLFIFIFLNSFSQNDSILHCNNKKLFLKKVEQLLKSKDSYDNKTEFLFNNFLYQQKKNNDVKKLYVEFLTNNLNKFYNKDVAKVYFAYCKDQYIRKLINKTKNLKKIDSLRKIRKLVDYRNIKILEKINPIKIYNLKGCSSNICKETLFYYFILVQHSNLDLMKFNLPFFKELSDLKILEKSNLAVMIDRIEISEHRPQIYGTQLYYDNSNKLNVSEIIDSKNVNIRRSEIGLEPIEDYLLSFGIKYNK